MSNDTGFISMSPSSFRYLCLPSSLSPSPSPSPSLSPLRFHLSSNSKGGSALDGQFGAHCLLTWKLPNNLSVLGGRKYVEEKTTTKLWTEAFLPDCLRTDMNRFGCGPPKRGRPQRTRIGHGGRDKPDRDRGPKRYGGCRERGTVRLIRTLNPQLSN